MCSNFCRVTWQWKVYYERKSYCNSQNASDVIGAVSHINFTKLTSFNKGSLQWLMMSTPWKTRCWKTGEEGATSAQTGHFFFQNKPQSDNQGNNLYVQFSLEICNLYCNKQTNIHVRLHQHDQLLLDTYFKYSSIFSLLSKSDQVEKVEGSAVENSVTYTLPWMSKSPRCLAKSVEVWLCDYTDTTSTAKQ